MQFLINCDLFLATVNHSVRFLNNFQAKYQAKLSVIMVATSKKPKNLSLARHS
jgi:hypothetical protein